MEFLKGVLKRVDPGQLGLPTGWPLAWVVLAVWGVPSALGQASGGGTSGQTSWWLPENVFPAADPIDRMFYFILYLTGAVCVAVFAVLMVFLIRYRYRAGRQAKFIHGHSGLEAVWTLIPTVVMALTAAFSQATWTAIKNPPAVADGEDVVRLEVIGKQFQWYYRYPGADGKLGPRRANLANPESSDTDELVGLDRSHPDAVDDIVAVRMFIPVNKKVLIDLSSVDVLHSFYLPNFRVKQDAVPGLTGRVWLEASKTSAEVIGQVSQESVLGKEADRKRLLDYLKDESDESVHKVLEKLILEGQSLDDFSPQQIAQLPLDLLPFEILSGYAKPFDIVCAELCGQGHYKMRGQLFVVSQKLYDALLAREASSLDLGGDDEEYY